MCVPENMSYSVFFILAFAATAYTNTSLTNEQLQDQIQSCIIKTRMSQVFKYNSETQRFCFIACMYKSSGVMNDDGSLNLNNATMDQPTLTALEKCSAEADRDHCQFAWCLHKTRKFRIPITTIQQRY